MRSELLAVAVLSLAHGACATDTVGSTSQDVVNTDVVNQSVAFDNAGADTAAFGVGCEITDPNPSHSTRKLMIDAGGIESGGTYSDDAVLYIPGVGYDPNARVAFTDARAFAVMITDPTDVNACLMFGGEDASTTKGQIVQLKAGWSGSVYTLAANNSGILSTARSRLQAVAIGTRVFLQGGFTGVGKTSASDVMDVWDSPIMNATISTLRNQNNNTVTLNHARGDFGADKSAQAGTRRIVVGGGTGLNSIEAFEVDANGNLTTTATHPADVTSLSPASRTTIGTARDGLILIYSAAITSNRETWVAGPGNNLSEVKAFDIEWGSFGSSNNTAPTNACTSGSLNAVTDPLNVKIAADRFITVGSDNANKNTVQEYRMGPCTSVTTDSSSTALETRAGALGALVDNHVYYTGGRDGATFRTTTFKVF